MIYFDEIDVLIDGSGIVAESANIDTENSLSPLYILGQKFAGNSIPNGPVKSNINLSYAWEPNFDPNLKIINNIKNTFQNFNFSPVNISVAGLTGLGFLESYSAKISQNDVGKISASYAIYTPLSGNFVGKQTGYFIDIIINSIPPTLNVFRINNGDSIRINPIPSGAFDWKTDTLANTIQNFWSNGLLGFDQSLPSKWNINGMKTYKINSGVRFVKLGSYPSPLVISGNWYQINSGGTYYNTYFTGGVSGLAHGWVLISNNSSSVTSPHFDFQYDLRVNWTPIYVLGSNIPSQIQLEGAEETFSIVQDIYNRISFTGVNASEIFDFSLLNIQAYTLQNLNNNGLFYNFNLSGAKVISNNLSAVTDDIVRVSTVAKKFF